ncbi:PRC-barrel domain-containing protein [Candidatus Saccharibacteria bacterium]|nr:PRC-barrel domain-containing protein [Candidatus Saccharibacteria bacterium]
MLVSFATLLNCPVLSLHVTAPIAWTVEEIVDPEKLKIVAFYVDGPNIKDDPEIGNILEVEDVREYGDLGMIIDSEERLVNPGDVVKLDKILELNFSLLGLKVVTKKGTKLGRIIDFLVDLNTFSIEQIIVKRPAMKAFLDPELVVPRREILEINDTEIVVKDEEDKIRKKAANEDFIPNFVNPFREPEFSASRIEQSSNPKEKPLR